MNQAEVTQQALSILRSGNLFQWYVIILLKQYSYQQSPHLCAPLCPKH